MSAPAGPRAPACDLVIRGATIFDGSGTAGAVGDLMVQSGRIVAVGRYPGGDAAVVLDATGLYAAPGFIDPHGHSDLTLLADPRGLSKLAQGITTEACGQCGMAPFPVPDDRYAEFRALLAYSWAPVDVTWRDAAGYLAEAGRRPLGLNLCPFLGANVLSLSLSKEAAKTEGGQAHAASVLGWTWGLSFGLGYEPLSRWSTDDLAGLAPLARGRTLGIHMRNEGSRLLESIAEAVSFAEGTSTRLEIAHLKAGRRANWGMMPEALAAIEEARRRGVDVAFNAYPYTASSTFLSAALPDWLLEEGQDRAVELLADEAVRERVREAGQAGHCFIALGAENILLSQVEADGYRWLEGLPLSDAAAQAGRDPLDLALDALVAAHGQVNSVFFTMSDDDVRLALAHPLGSICTDGLAFCPDGPTSAGRPHPRSYGTFPRFLGHYVRDEGLLDWPEALRKCTSWPASRLGLRDRGLLRPGYAADIVLFDPATLLDRATYQEPHQLPAGIEYVIVNGVVSMAHGQPTGALGGRLLDPQREQRAVSPAAEGGELLRAEPYTGL